MFTNGAYYNGELFKYDDFGNYNFGVAAKAYGLSLNFSKLGAGVAQVLWGEERHWSWWKTMFDDPQDARMIERGYNHFKK